MSLAITLWFVLGMFAGVVHAWMLWRASQPPFVGAAWHLPRILVVGGILFAAAVGGGLLAAVAGWTTGYFASVAAVALRRPQ